MGAPHLHMPFVSPGRGLVARSRNASFRSRLHYLPSAFGEIRSRHESLYLHFSIIRKYNVRIIKYMENMPLKINVIFLYYNVNAFKFHS